MSCCRTNSRACISSDPTTAAPYPHSPHASGIAVFVDSLKKKNASLIPVAEKIDEMESQVDQMEAIVQQLDIYSRNLETRARTLQIC